MPDWARMSPMSLWRRRRWVVIGSGAAALVVLYLITGSVLDSILLLLVLAALIVVALMLAHRHAASAGQPAQQGPAGPPAQSQDAQQVWQSALRHLPDMFTMAPDRTLLAPGRVELLMNPGDLSALGQLVDPHLVTASSNDAYRARIAERGARMAAGSGQPEVALFSDPDIPPGRYRLRPGDHVAPPGAAGTSYPPADWGEIGGHPPAGRPGPDGPADTPAAARTVAINQGGGGDHPTVSESLPVPPLRLLSGGMVAETRNPGARAGRGDVELRLPDVPTVSRVHAEFAYSDGQWWITNRGRNGLTLNGTPVTSQRPVNDGDMIQWGNRHDALTSRVQVG